MKAILLFFVGFALFVVGITTVKKQSEAVRIGYRLHALDRRIEELREEVKSYALEVEALRSPRRILACAQALKLSRPEDGDVRIERAGPMEEDLLSRFEAGRPEQQQLWDGRQRPLAVKAPRRPGWIRRHRTPTGGG